MKEKRVISFKSLPTKMPIHTTIISYLLFREFYPTLNWEWMLWGGCNIISRFVMDKLDCSTIFRGSCRPFLRRYKNVPGKCRRYGI